MPEPLVILALAGACVIACAAHAALGFGSGPLLVPALLLVTRPGAAVVAAVLVGMLVNVLQLVAEGRRPRPPVRVLAPLWLAAPPGAAAAAALAGGLPASALAIVLAAVLALCGTLLLAAPERRLRLGAAGMATAGAATAMAATVTGVFGPVLGTLLVARGCRGAALRDGIGASFLAVGACAVVATLAVVEGATAGLPLAAALAVPAVAGHALGRRWAGRLPPPAQRRGVLVAVLVGSGLALAGAL
jgi:uncharacterized membrane protein YfcA